MNDKDIFSKVINIGLRMYGNGYAYPKEIVEYITEYCRQEIRNYFLKHNQLIKDNKQLSFLSTFIYTSRYKKSCLKRLQHFLQAKDRSTAQQEEIKNEIIKDKKLRIHDRFQRICKQIQIEINDKQNQSIDKQRSRQYSRVDNYYKSDTLTSNDYLLFVEEQHNSFNNLRLLSSNDIQSWLNINQIILSKTDLRLAEFCVFFLKEILLNLMDNVYKSTNPCQINDVLRRQYVQNKRRLSYSGRKRIIH